MEICTIFCSFRHKIIWGFLPSRCVFLFYLFFLCVCVGGVHIQYICTNNPICLCIFIFAVTQTLNWNFTRLHIRLIPINWVLDGLLHFLKNFVIAIIPTAQVILCAFFLPTDLTVTGILHTEKFGDYRKFESVSVSLNGSDVLTVAVTSVRINNITYRWWQLSSLRTDDVTITGGDTIELKTPSNASLVFHKYGIQTRRSLSTPFITVSVKYTQNLSPDSSGVIGMYIYSCTC